MLQTTITRQQRIRSIEAKPKYEI